MERTLVIIKPDAVERNLIGQIIKTFEENGMKVIGLKMVKLTKEQAESFYRVHKGKHFFESLTNYMSSGPSVVILLEGKDVIKNVRRIMGATDPKKAEEGTIRHRYGIDVEKNSVHGSDSPESAEFEIGFFFNELEICPR